MFNMHNIGKRISSLRKEKGITQMELADKLGISFQAVSNWERGNTMPDISKLSELSQILGVTIEELIGDERKGKVVEEIANGDVSNVKAEDLADIAPIVNDEQFKRAYEQTAHNDTGIDITTVVSIAPYLDEDVLYSFVKDSIGKGAKIADLIELAPYMDESDLGELVNSIADENTPVEDISQLAPYLDEEDLGKVCRRIIAVTKSIDGIVELAPYTDEDDLTDIAADYLKNGGSFNDLEPIAPFLDMNKLFREFYKK